MKALDLHCVSIKTKTVERLRELKDRGEEDSSIGRLHDGVESLLIKLHMDKPQWRFEIVGDYMGRLYKFEVYQDLECLGTVESTYIGRKVGHGYAIRNDRISEAMARGNAYQTGDIDKAYVRIKKMFIKKSLAEIAGKAQSEANKTIIHNHSRKRSEKVDVERKIQRYALDYVMNAGLQQFLEYISTKAPITEKNTVDKAMLDVEELKSQLITIEQVKDNLGTNKTAIIIKDGSSYIYKHGEMLTTYDDTTLPDEIKGKLGLLKLVEAEHYIENTGCRVNDEVFVIVMEEKHD